MLRRALYPIPRTVHPSSPVPGVLWTQPAGLLKGSSTRMPLLLPGSLFSNFSSAPGSYFFYLPDWGFVSVSASFWMDRGEGAIRSCVDITCTLKDSTLCH